MANQEYALVVEPNPGGHRLHFAALLAEGLLERNRHAILITSDEAVGSRAWSFHFSHLLESIQVSSCLRSDFLGHPGAGEWRQLLGTVNSRTSDVYIPDGDRLTHMVSLHPRMRRAVNQHHARFHALVLRPWFAYEASTPRGLFRAKASGHTTANNPWHRTLLLDPFAAEQLSQGGGMEGIALVPEPVEQVTPVPQDVARIRLGLPTHGNLIVLPGRADHRKGADKLILAVDSMPDSVRLLLAGPSSPAIAQLLRHRRGRNGRVVLWDRYLGLDEFWLSIFAADVIAMPYNNHVGSSGILARAAFAGRPVVASDFGWIAEATRRYGLGIVSPANSPHDVASAIDQVLNGKREQPHADPQAYIRENTPVGFKRAWLGDTA